MNNESLENSGDDTSIQSVSPLKVYKCRPTYNPVTLVVRDLCYEVPSKEVLPGCSNSCLNRKQLDGGVGGKKVLLDSVSMIARPGELLAIIGPSGSGKTTLLNVLAMRSAAYRVPSGSVTFNGRQETKETMRSSVNYVMAHDKLLPYLTVYETFKSAAALKLPHLSYNKRLERIERIMADMSLENYRDTYIGGEWRKGLSTGELKRVAIGIELLDEPSVLILDEPTSGLDSSLSTKIIEILVKESRQGRTIICSIHQPSSQIFELFDQLLLLSLGRVVYHGPADATLSYFSRLGFTAQKDWNPCDYLLDLITEQARKQQVSLEDGDQESTHAPDSLSNTWTESPEYMRILAEGRETEERLALIPRRAGRTRKGANWCHETRTLWKRTTLNSLRNPITAIVLILIQAMQGLILGGIFFHQSTAWAGPQPEAMISSDFWNNPFTQALSFGYEPDANRPLLNMFEQGVDGNGSYILFGPDQDEKAWQKPLLKIVANLSPCVYKHFDLPNRGYQNLTKQYVDPIGNWDDWTPKLIYSNLMGFYQIFDFMYMDGLNKFPMDLSFVKTCKQMICLMQRVSEHVNPFFKCLGLPNLPSQTKLPKIKPKFPDRLPFSPKQYPLRTGSASMDDMINKIMGPNLMQLVNAANQWVLRSTRCQDEICQQLKKIFDVAIRFTSATLQTVLTALSLSGCLFFVSTILGFASYDALLTFPQERALFNRESANGLYRPSSYYVAKNIADLPFQLIPSLLMATIYYFLVGFDATLPQFLIYFATCILTSFCAYGFGYMVSAASPRMEVAILVAPLSLVIWLVLAGFFLRDPDIPAWIAWFKYVSFYRWSFFTFVSNQFPPAGYFGTLPNTVILGLAGVTQTSVSLGVLYLTLLGILYRLLGFVFLAWTNRSVGLEA